MDNNMLLEIKHLNKTYPGVRALKDISMHFERGKVHGLVGENGAGKSTLIKMISGSEYPDNGEIIFDGKAYANLSPSLSKALGIGCVYQEFNLAPAISVAENIYMGPPAHKIVNFREMYEKTAELFDMLQIKINPKAKVSSLSVAYMQMVEIAKALAQNARFLILDEPTAPLTTEEVTILFRIVNRLRDHGVTIVFISHRLDELYEICDDVTIMRDGEVVAILPIEEAPKDVIIKHMVGREMNEVFPERTMCEDDTILFEAKNIYGNGLEDISLHVRKGEILGLAGLVGAGRTELTRLFFGADKIESGQLFFNGKEVKISCPRDAVELGIGLVPEDRKNHGVVLKLPIRTNITLAIIRKISKLLFIDTKKENVILDRMKKAFAIKTPSFNQLVKNLSGGNQQKVILAKWMAGDTKLLILDEPTRGIDVGAKQEIYNFMNRLTKEGIAIIMVSSEMEEVLGMSDRILVLREGQLSGELKKEEFSQVRVMQLASNV